MVNSLAEPTLVPPDAILLGNGRSRRFQGSDHGAGVSYFYVENQPGQGSRLHWHPYPETWVVLDGDVTFQIGDQQIAAAVGDTVTGPGYVPHKFTNTGTGTMRLLGIHASAVIIQTDLE